jgi:endo-1,4-beta-xylanase
VCAGARYRSLPPWGAAWDIAAMLRIGLKSRWILVGLVLLGCGGSREPVQKSKPTNKPNAAGSAGNGGASDRDASSGRAGMVCSGNDIASLPGLRELGLTVGVAVSNRRLSDTSYSAVVGKEFNSLTPENELKWDATEASSGNFSFAAADELVRFAEAHQMVVRGHTLVWHNQLPDWVTQLSDADAVRSAMRRHIQTVIGHFRDQFPGRVVAWDVVNEALDTKKDESGNDVAFFRDSVFYRYLGEGYIAEAFQIAHQVDPNALLYYNDYGIEGIRTKANAAYDLLRGLVEQGVPISGVGLQMHTHAADLGPSLADFEANLTRYAELGLPVNLSEMDASLCLAQGSLAERIQAQRVRYNAVVAACLRNGNCKSVTVWGVADSDSWLTSTRPCDDPAFTPSPLLFDDAYQRKPAWAGFWDALNGCYY